MLLQKHIKDPCYSAKSAGGRLHLNLHTPLTLPSWSGPTMLSRNDVGTYGGNRLTRKFSWSASPLSFRFAELHLSKKKKKMLKSTHLEFVRPSPQILACNEKSQTHHTHKLWETEVCAKACSNTKECMNMNVRVKNSICLYMRLMERVLDTYGFLLHILMQCF